MKPFYAIREANAIADTTHVGEKRFEINRINVPKVHRGKGYGRILLNQITADADQQGMTLQLFANSYHDGGLTNEQLVRWYERRGFVMIHPEARQMERLPRPRVPAEYFEDHLGQGRR